MLSGRMPHSPARVRIHFATVSKFGNWLGLLCYIKNIPLPLGLSKNKRYSKIIVTSS